MASVRFYVIGVEDTWVRLRITEEIQATGLDGHAIDAADGTLAVIVEGDLKTIRRLYQNLEQSLPEAVQLTAAELSKIAEKTTKSTEDDALELIIELLKEMEKTMRKINNKLDQALTATEPETTTSHVDEIPALEDEAEDDGGQPCGFAAMFGD